MKKYAFGVDLGGTTVKMGLFKTDSTLLKKWEIKTDRSENGKNILNDIADSITQCLKENQILIEDVQGIGMGVPGPVTKDGVVLRCVNLGWDIVEVEKVLSNLTKVPVKAGNDANVAALGEMWKGGGEGYKSIVMITLGTGVGGGIVIDEEILPGTNGAAGEIGHFPVNDEETDVCGCGKKGCLEQYASASGIVRMAKKYLEENKERETTLRQFDDLTSKDIFDQAKIGDEVAVEQVGQVCRILGKTLAYVACTTDPESFVIGGGVSKAGDILIDGIKKYYQEYTFHATKKTDICLATLGNDAGIYGGVKMVLK